MEVHRTASPIERYIPYVVEPSLGADRVALAFLGNAYEEEQLENDIRVVLRLHPALAPYKAAVRALQEMIAGASARRLQDLARDFMMEYGRKPDPSASGYRRQDEDRPAVCITVDFDTEAHRHGDRAERDSMQQERVAIGDLRPYISERIAF